MGFRKKAVWMAVFCLLFLVSSIQFLHGSASACQDATVSDCYYQSVCDDSFSYFYVQGDTDEKCLCHFGSTYDACGAYPYGVCSDLYRIDYDCSSQVYEGELEATMCITFGPLNALP